MFSAVIFITRLKLLESGATPFPRPSPQHRDYTVFIWCLFNFLCGDIYISLRSVYLSSSYICRIRRSIGLNESQVIHRTSRLSCYCCFTCGRLSVRVSTKRPDILIENFRSCHKFFQTNVRRTVFNIPISKELISISR